MSKTLTLGKMLLLDISLLVTVATVIYLNIVQSLWADPLKIFMWLFAPYVLIKNGIFCVLRAKAQQTIDYEPH